MMVGEEAAKLGRRCLLVSGKTFAKRSGHLDATLRSLSSAGLNVTAFDRVEPNPSFDTVRNGAEVARKHNCDVVVGLGGGSAMDAAKAIAFLASSEVKLEDFVVPEEVAEVVAPTIAIPTTCGTGSEVTKYAVLTDVVAKKKRVLMGVPLIPKVALLDANLLDSLPSYMVAYTGFDALSHSLEALLSKASNAVSDMFATESATIICRNLGRACEGDLESRERTLLGSMLAGIAINSTGTTIVHGIGYYLTNYHNIHHGLANAIILPHVLRFEGEYVKEKLERIASVLGLTGLASLLESLEKLADQVGIPRSLLELQVDEDELDAMIEDAISYKRNIDNNPTEISAEDIRDICLRAFKGRGAEC